MQHLIHSVPRHKSQANAQLRHHQQKSDSVQLNKALGIFPHHQSIYLDYDYRISTFNQTAETNFFPDNDRCGCSSYR